MKKSVIFLINGLGIEKANSYSISLDQCMPNLAKTRETSYFTTAHINELEENSAYQSFFIGDTSKMELKYLKEQLINDSLPNNPTFQNLAKAVTGSKKIHIFLDPTNDLIVEEINTLISKLQINSDQKIYLHLLLSQLTLGDYDKLITRVNYIKYHIYNGVNVGFIMGKSFLSKNLTKNEMDYMKKMLFYCSCERWTETEKKLVSLKEQKIRPCDVPGFTATNDCTLENGDTILFFNTKSENLDNIIQSIYMNASSAYGTDDFALPCFSIVSLDTQYDIKSFIDNITYNNSLSSILARVNKKALIIADETRIRNLNFLANGFKNVNNPQISFMKKDDAYLENKANINNIIMSSPYDLIIFDYHMDVSKTINDLKDQLTKVDVVLGYIADACVNNHSLFITSLYGLKKSLPVAPYNAEMVTLDYQLQIPIFFFDYSYPRSKYTLFPGYTNDILLSSIKCIAPEFEYDSIIKLKGIVNNLFAGLKKK